MRMLCVELGSRMTDISVTSTLILLFVVWKRNSVLVLMEVERYGRGVGDVPIMERGEGSVNKCGIKLM